jgi:putative sterol carrier protein
MQFHSREWLEAYKEKMNSDPEYLKKASNFSIKWCNVITDCPGGVDRKETWIIEKGKCVSVTTVEKPAPSDFRTEPFNSKEFDYRNIASYEIMAKLFRGQMSTLQAFRNPNYKVDGPKAKLLLIMKQLNAWNDIAKKIPTEI